MASCICSLKDPDNGHREKPNLELSINGEVLSAKSIIKVLSIKFDEKMNFKAHVKGLARNRATELAALRPLSSSLSPESCKILYEAQVRPPLEYAPLTWISCPASYLSLLDKVDERARRIINECGGGVGFVGPAYSLQHRRDVAGVTALHKATFLDIPWLSALRGTPMRRTYATTSPPGLFVPRSRTSLHQRSFMPRVTRNAFITSVDSLEHSLTQSVKV
ncbi:uncharacterized protein LOC125048371 [Penaeus chinensis]|uniref:uncharacterized protein LOC125048371 n=1 Tax=Penaeus chinensis TaxID=139456 RepID=UPI001FB64190|nr:uncharacterized protein LOC125048371 [Penaeus chinensis]